MKRERATKKQQELLQFVIGFIREHDYGPSYREIMRALDYKSVSTVATHINGLVAKGFLQRKDNSPRSLAIVSSRDTAGEGAAVKETAPILKQLDEKLRQTDLSDEDKEALKRVKQLFGG